MEFRWNNILKWYNSRVKQGMYKFIRLFHPHVETARISVSKILIKIYRCTAMEKLTTISATSELSSYQFFSTKNRHEIIFLSEISRGSRVFRFSRHRRQGQNGPTHLFKVGISFFLILFLFFSSRDKEVEARVCLRHLRQFRSGTASARGGRFFEWLRWFRWFYRGAAPNVFHIISNGSRRHFVHSQTRLFYYS